MSGFHALMNAAPSDIEKLNSAITNCDGKAGDMAETMQNNLEGQITILKSQLQELAISFGDILMPAIRQIVSWIQGLVDKLNGMDEGTKKTIVTIGNDNDACSENIWCNNCRQGCNIGTEFSRTSYKPYRFSYCRYCCTRCSFYLSLEYK